MKKRILSLVLATLMIISVLPAHALADDEVLYSTASGITATKSAKWVGDGKDGIAEVTIKVQGKAPEETVLTTPTDIVLVIDYSSGMGKKSKLDNAKKAATKFAETMLNGDNVRMAVVPFIEHVHDDTNFSSDLDAVKAAIQKIEAAKFLDEDAGTNIQEGLHVARQKLKQSKAENKIIIVLTDGKPNRAYKNEATGKVILVETYGPTTKVSDSDALKYNIGSNYRTLYKETDFRYNDRDVSLFNREEKTVSEALFAKRDGYDVYAIGFGINDQGKRVLQSVASKGMYYDSGISEDEITGVFNKIAQNVKNYCAYAPKVTDVIGTDFDYYEDNTYKPSQSITKSTDGRTLTWNVGDYLDATEKTLTFYVKYKNLDDPANPSANGGKLDTNSKAELTYKTEKEGTTETTLNIDLANSKVPNLAKKVSYNDGADDEELTVPADKFYWPGKPVTVAGALTRDGYDFDGWYIDSAKQGSTFTMPSNDVTLTAKWTQKQNPPTDTYSVSYQYDNASELPEGIPAAPTDSAEYNAGASVNVKNPEQTSVTINGKIWKFGGWYVGENKVDGTTYTINSNVTFHGSWTSTDAPKDTYTLSYEFVSGTPGKTLPSMTNPDSVQVEAGEMLPIPEDFSKTVDVSDGHWTFGGWYLEAQCTNRVTPQNKMPAEAKTIYGKWTFTPNQQPVEYVPIDLSIDKTVLSKRGVAPSEWFEFEVYYYDDNDQKVVISGNEPLKVYVGEGDENANVDFTIYPTVEQMNNWPAGENNGHYAYVRELAGRTEGMNYASTPIEGVILQTPVISSAQVSTFAINQSAIKLSSLQGQADDFYFTNEYTKPTDGKDVTPAKVSPQLNRDDHVAYIMGYPDGKVRPEGEITRAEACTIFFRLLTEESRDYYFTKTNDYTDVSRSDWFNNAISTLSNAGIVMGYADGTFRPDQPITRGEMAKIIANFARLGGATKSFTDLSGHWAKTYVELAAGNGWIEGYPDGTFGPDKKITRAETVTMINRVLDRVPAKESRLLPRSVMLTFPDNEPGEWYYIAIQEATNSHTYQRSVYETAGDEMWIKLIDNVDWTKLEK